MWIRLLKKLALLLAVAGGVSITAEAGTANFRYYRFTTVSVRSGFNNSVQLGEFAFFSDGQTITTIPQVSNPGGNNPEGEGPANLVDGDATTKWLDFDREPVVFDFGTPMEVDLYGFTTANDASSRDPVRWYLEGSNNGGTWTLLDDRTGDIQAVSTARYVAHEWELTSAPDLPQLLFQVSASGVESSSAVRVESGETATLTWTVEEATSATVEAGGSVLSTQTTGHLDVSPTMTTTYLLTGSNAVGSRDLEVVVYVGTTVEPVVLNEFASDVTDDGGLLDEDHEPSDWIELFNPNPFALSLTGYGITDDDALMAPWMFPEGASIEAESYVLVFASGKDRRIVGGEYHTDFSLSKNGEFLAWIGPSGVLQVLDPYPAMYEDVSYGRRTETDGNWDHFTIPTPGAANDTDPGAPGALVELVTPPATFTTSIEVEMTTDSTGAEIRYTLDGSLPEIGSMLYTGPVVVTSTAQVKARTFESGRAPGEVAAAGYVKLASSLTNFSSDLPVVILENFAAGDVPADRTLQAAEFSLFEPDAETGRTTLTSLPTESHRCGIKRRGSSTLNNPKGNYRVEFWQDGNDEELDVPLLGLPEHDEWVLYAPFYYDRALIRNAFLFGLSNDIGRWAPHTRFCEVYLNTDGGTLTESDYQGVYVLMERISRDGDRVDVDKLTAADDEAPEITGGYILSIDRRDDEDLGFRSALGHPFDPPNAEPQPWFNYVYPKEQNITTEQSAYIRGYVDDMEAALYGSEFTDPDVGYRAWFDAEASIDHHLMVTFSKDPDGLRLSTYLYKPRLGKLSFGPLWDFDRGMGPDYDDRSADPEGWNPEVERAEFFEYDYWGRLFQDPDFMQQWIDRWQELRRGVFSDVSMAARVDAMAAELAEAEVRNAARWPGVAPNGGALSSLSGYAGEVDHLKNWMEQRAAWIDTQFVAPPVLTPGGGRIESGTVVTAVPTEGTLWYTVDGSDPRLPGGSVNPEAISVGNGTVEAVLFDEASAEVHVLRPTSSAPGALAWTDPAFNDSGWLTGQFGVGYELSSGYEPYLSTIVHDGNGGGPTSVYVRVPFEVSVPASGFGALKLRLRYEDGFVAYLNGTLVASSNAPASLEWNSGSTAVRADSLAVNFAEIDLSGMTNLLVDGENVLAIHALNDGDANATNTGSSSSDMLISAELVAEYSVTGDGQLVLNDTTQLVARSYSNGEWSGPVEATYVVGKPATAENLVVSEIMYHPANPNAAEEEAGFLEDGDFEFLELRNISSIDTIDLTGVVISNCFDFDFTGAEQTLVAPGGSVLVVRHRAAFEYRYGSGLAVAGEWGDASLPDGGSNLSNGGERIVLTAADGSVIRDFTYDDAAPWPVSPDGDGPSLELISPFDAPDHGVGTNWRASTEDGGTPGDQPAGSDYDSWAAGYFSPAQLADESVSGPMADPDLDGLANAIERVFGSDPLTNSPESLPVAALQEIEGETYLTITFTRDPSVTDVAAWPQFSSELEDWSEESVLLLTLPHDDGTETVTYRDAIPATGNERFARVRVGSAE
ncbi:hypothetical protein HNR46_002170 [Haloferula luteola]|uniref:LTD domain-containing protein n=1 Tax=Haloferula luteola TaxID=595692 RepID=A0A840VGM0_9BACT|nr:CotH kinase family protein [Haloferula luteola]MBB5351931.1 hypothetical protein [Haloferula luteola]